MKTFNDTIYHANDGMAYYFVQRKDGSRVLMASVSDKKNNIDLDTELAVEDFAEPLSEQTIEYITHILKMEIVYEFESNTKHN